ncbi:response regulator [Streptacidiphilus monticola]|uniref:Response regulator n=1 Tax=Streptacidiphilus monticola TaxID=2161674 RepID=A0ABW1G0I7_9ACTN
MTRILVVDDEPQMLRALRINLQARKYTVATALTGTAALDEFARRLPDAVLLDLGLPDLDGFEVIQALRLRSRVPIIVVSGRSGAAEKVAALDAGADDYVTKPFSMSEILARVRALLRRPAGADTSPRRAVVGEYTVDLDECTVRRTADGASTAVGAETVRLTPTEWKILSLLLPYPGRLVSAGHLLAAVRGPGHERNTNYLRVYFTGLRRKLEPDPAHPRHLITEPGMGYRYEP